jgi:predicted TIM-barrel fold metal-dependent hydrolase
MSELHPSLERVLDAHTHLSGSENGEKPEDILSTLDAAGVDKAFVFAPLLDTHSWQLTTDDINHVRTHNDYCADLCNTDPERLYAFCVLNPTPGLADGDKRKAVSLMIEEARRCYDELGIRGVKMVPAGWYPNDPDLLPLYEAVSGLHMYTVFHAGIFTDAKEGSFCRPAFYEMVHRADGMRAQMAHLGWPWIDETLAVLEQEDRTHGSDPKNWQLRADVSFGPPDDWQLRTWELALTGVSPRRLIYGSDSFWPMSADEYRESYLIPQLGLFETACTDQHVAPEGSPERRDLRQGIFHDHGWEHWCSTIREPQSPRAAHGPISTPAASASPRQS